MTRVAEGIYDRVLTNGRRVFDIVYDLPRHSPGKRNQKWERGFSSLSRAKARRAAVVTDLQRGTYVEPAKGSHDGHETWGTPRTEVGRTDMDIGELKIVETIVPVNHKPTWSVPKTDAGFRTIPLDTRTIEVLRDHRRRQLEERLAFGSDYVDLDLVFPDPNGTMFNPENQSKRFHRRVTKLGLKEIRFHDLRHTYATLGRRSGMDIKDLTVRLGHENVATTMNLYQHIPVDMARESAQSVADYILG